MSGVGPRNSDKLNTLGIVVAGLAASAGVYVMIILLQSFYMHDVAEVQTMADYGGQEKTAASLRAAQIENISQYVNRMGGADGKSTHQVPIERAMELVVADAQKDPSNLVPVIGPSVTPTAQPIYGRPKALEPAAPPAAPAAPASDATAPAAASAPTTTAAPEAAPPAAAAPAAPAAPTRRPRAPATTRPR